MKNGTFHKYPVKTVRQITTDKLIDSYQSRGGIYLPVRADGHGFPSHIGKIMPGAGKGENLGFKSFKVINGKTMSATDRSSFDDGR
ncbi:MAG: hypothetical protein DSY57_04595 [Desulfobulbus sp.]|nr:MAG: hypothetical protein DSY57_04595 [Desulfobulbus sp.]